MLSQPPHGWASVLGRSRRGMGGASIVIHSSLSSLAKDWPPTSVGGHQPGAWTLLSYAISKYPGCRPRSGLYHQPPKVNSSPQFENGETP